jgi:ribosomal protein S27E
MTADPDLTNVTQLPIKPKPRLEEESERFLVVEHRGCAHRGGFTLNESEECITCKLCGEKLNPMYALKMLAQQETRWHETRKRYQEEMKRLDERSRTTCEHCGKMTRISKPRR